MISRCQNGSNILFHVCSIWTYNYSLPSPSQGRHVTAHYKSTNKTLKADIIPFGCNPCVEEISPIKGRQSRPQNGRLKTVGPPTLLTPWKECTGEKMEEQLGVQELNILEGVPQRTDPRAPLIPEHLSSAPESARCTMPHSQQLLNGRSELRVPPPDRSWRCSPHSVH
ncbi:hypothetical protein RRG08_032367 [Elysia crispata]|uniref:Uncharacterized protein n=1 Tax=Elysia crispata TaxID=231223 RepID=A0AAE1DY67_9GAST|nr:hypothetical protein RRG08_032367 [Elysia crispata]